MARGPENAEVAEEELEKLLAEVSRLDSSNVVLVARAFAHFLRLANVAEQNHRVRIVHRRRNAGLASIEDIASTIVRVAGGTTPDGASCEELDRLDGVSATQPLTAASIDEMVDALQNTVSCSSSSILFN